MIAFEILINKFLKEGGYPILVGGSVRDRFLGKSSKDFDIEIHGLTYEQVLNILKFLGPVCCVGKSFGVFKLFNFDIGLPRVEYKGGYTHKDFYIDYMSNLNYYDASMRRDFTINSMGINFFNGLLLDPHFGKLDLKVKRVKHISVAFGEDSLRVLRACRFSSVLGFNIWAQTIAICQQLRFELQYLPRERIGLEFCKILMSSKPSLGIRSLIDTHAYYVFPELFFLSGKLYAEKVAKLLDSVDMLSCQNANLNLRLSIFCHYIGVMYSACTRTPKHSVEIFFIEQFLQRINIPNKDIEHILSTIQNLRFCFSLKSLDNIFLYKLAAKLNIEELCILKYSLETEKGMKYLFEKMLKKAQRLGILNSSLSPIIKGRDLILQGIMPGPLVGKIVKLAYQSQIDGGFYDARGAKEWLFLNVNKILLDH